jgi:UDP-N-acetylmuramyl pentapeptide phosphotransferase/UDP-N-acetylglucosamine-1-phosphate transferase
MDGMDGIGVGMLVFIGLVVLIVAVFSFVRQRAEKSKRSNRYKFK